MRCLPIPPHSRAGRAHLSTSSEKVQPSAARHNRTRGGAAPYTLLGGSLGPGGPGGGRLVSASTGEAAVLEAARTATTRATRASVRPLGSVRAML